MSSAGPPAASYARFLLGNALWFLAFGLQSLVFPWLVVDVLRESPARVGLAQTLSLVPALPLLLVGGTLADRFEPRRLLVALHLGFALLCAALAALVAGGGLTYPRLLGFALLGGALSALQAPARDAQLYPIARASLSRGVVGANLATQGAQAAGGLAGALLAGLGAPAVLLVQAGLALAGAIPVAALRAPAVPPGALQPGARPGLAAIAAALRTAWHSPVLRPVVLLNLAVGVLFVGPYGVVLPLLVRDVYAGGPREIGVLMAMLPLGGIAASLAVFARGGIRRNGRALLLGQGFASLCIGALAVTPPFAGAAAAVLLWGVGSAFLLSAGRTLCFGSAPEGQRATLLALHALGILGGGVAGSLLSGALVSLFGTPATLALQAAAMLGCLVLAALRSEVARL
jgi:MFS family permease